MWHRLALGIGGATILELQTRMGSSEFTAWCDYWKQEPWGTHRDNLHAAMIAQQISAGRPRKPGHRGPTMQDFMLRSAAEQRQTNVNSALNFLRRVAKPAAGNQT